MNNLPDPAQQDDTVVKPANQYPVSQVKMGSLAKEKEIPQGASYIEKVQEAPELAPEVENIGVVPIREEIELSKQDKHAGLEASAEAVPVITQPSGLVNLPLTDDQMQKALHQKITESIVWLAVWCLRRMRIIHHKSNRAGN